VLQREICFLADAGGKPQSYSSPAIIARRKRILEETRKAISEQGMSSLSMGEIGQRAGVAKRTLYNAFQTRERMVAAALQEYFDEFSDRIRYEHPAGTLMHNVERLVSGIQFSHKVRNYARAVMALYFSRDADHDIWSTIQAMVIPPNRQWIKALGDKKQLQPWVNVDGLVNDLGRIECATINDWSLGRIPDGEIIVRLVGACLTHVVGATRGAARKEIEEMLLKIEQEGEKALPVLKLVDIDRAA
jgi:AcrR family transcriptional regulator